MGNGDIGNTSEASDKEIFRKLAEDPKTEISDVVRKNVLSRLDVVPSTQTQKVEAEVLAAEPGTSPLPGGHVESIAGVPGGGAKVSAVQATSEFANSTGVNPATAEASKVGTPAATVDGKPALTSRTW